MPQFDDFANSLTESLSTELAAAISNAPEMPLGDGTLHAPLVTLLNGGIGDHLIGVSPPKQMECLSGLWLVAGDIHRSHTISQDLGSAEGSFLHGIMHRREGDYGNAKYWFRRVGDHPVFSQLAHQTNQHYQDPFEFVDQCSRAAESGDPNEQQRCIDSQWTEWQALMAYIVNR